MCAQIPPTPLDQHGYAYNPMDGQTSACGQYTCMYTFSVPGQYTNVYMYMYVYIQCTPINDTYTLTHILYNLHWQYSPSWRHQ